MNNDFTTERTEFTDGGERGSYFFKNSLSLGLFLCVLCITIVKNLRGLRK